MTNLTVSHLTASHFDKKQRLCPAEQSYVEQPHSTTAQTCQYPYLYCSIGKKKLVNTSMKNLDSNDQGIQNNDCQTKPIESLYFN